jgi:predicted nucleotidyltransferase
MNPASQWRRSFAQQIAPVYAANPKVAAVILGGSTARGHADRYSDIEVGVFWRQPPAAADCRSAADEIDGDLLGLYLYDPVEEVWCDDFMLGRAHPDQPRSGVLVEVVRYTTEFLGRTFDAILQHYDPNPLKQNLIAGIVDGLPLQNAR